MYFFRKQKEAAAAPLVPLAFYRTNAEDKNPFFALATINADGDILTANASIDQLSQVLADWSATLGVKFTPVETRYLTAISGFSEYSRLLPLPSDAPTDPDFLPAWLEQAIRSGTVGSDGMPLFEHTFDTHAACLAVSGNGAVVLSSAPRESVGRSVSQLLFNDDQPNSPSSVKVSEDDNLRLLVNVETPARAAARWVVSALPDLPENGEMLVFLIVAEDGNCIAFYDRERGLFYESAALLNPLDMESENDLNKDMFSDIAAPLSASDSTFSEINPLSEICAFAGDRLRNLLNPERFAELGIVRVKNIYLVTRENLESGLCDELAEYAEWLQTSLLVEPFDETVVKGLLIGLQNPAESFAVSSVPPINFAYDIYSQAVNQESQADLELDRLAVRRRHKVIAALVLPLIVICAVVLGSLLTEFRRAATLTARESEYQKEKKRLEPKIQARQSYEKNLKWYHEYLTQIYELRLRQGTALNLFSDLNQRYPLAFDDAFYIAELKLSVNGQLEMRGLARQEQAFTAFVRSLEASETVAGTDRRIFTNLTPDFGQGVKITTPTNSLLQSTVSGGSQIAANLPPGVVGWKIGGIYSPVAMLKPLTSVSVNNVQSNQAGQNQPNQSPPGTNAPTAINQNRATTQMTTNPNGGNK